MNELINEKYINLIANSGEFREFVNKMDKYTTEEIIALYELKNDIISCYSGL